MQPTPLYGSLRASRGCITFRPQKAGRKARISGTDLRSRSYRPVTRRQRSKPRRRWVDTQSHKRPVRGDQEPSPASTARGVNAMRIRATESFRPDQWRKLSKWLKQMSFTSIEAYCDRFSSLGRFASSSRGRRISHWLRRVWRRTSGERKRLHERPHGGGRIRNRGIRFER
jgi:hypothetical protein